jgi:predicted metalloprotease with PDZ domain
MKRAVVALAFGPLLLSISCSSLADGAEATVQNQTATRATGGFATSAPSEDLVRELGLENNVRVQGRRVDYVEPDGPADSAGLREGDVVLRLGENDLYSADDIADFLAVSTPGVAVTVEFERPDEGALTATITLGERPAPASSEPRLRWQFSGLGQLPRALDLARAKKKKVMVGLSGAET